MTVGYGSTPARASWIYAVLYKDKEGRDLGSLGVEPDFLPACEGALFRAIRTGAVPPVLCDRRTTIEPVWDLERGAPILAAARVIVAPDPALSAGDGDLAGGCGGLQEAAAVFEDVPAQGEIFRELAQAGSQKMIERGVLAEGQSFSFEIAAYPSDESASDDPDGDDMGFGFDLDFEEGGVALPLRERPIEELASSARVAGCDAEAADMRVFIPQEVLDQACAHAEGSGDQEVGGFLLGFLERSPGDPDVFVAVTAQVPARHTDATSSSLTFTSETWSAVDDAVALRARGESIVGWYHKHPNFAEKACAKCPEERRRHCPMSRPFFSSTDVRLHRAVFPRAYQTALLLSDLGQEDFDVRLYGWRHGAVVSRAFEILSGDCT